MRTPKNHANIDWEYIVDCFTQTFYGRTYNPYDYLDTKNICEDEVMYFMEHNEDTLPMVRARIRERIKARRR